MDVQEYMNRRCMCGATRAEHAHVVNNLTDLGDNTNFRVVAITNNHCRGFTDEIEREFVGLGALKAVSKR